MLIQLHFGDWVDPQRIQAVGHDETTNEVYFTDVNSQTIFIQGFDTAANAVAFRDRAAQTINNAMRQPEPIKNHLS